MRTERPLFSLSLIRGLALAGVAASAVLAACGESGSATAPSSTSAASTSVPLAAARQGDDDDGQKIAAVEAVAFALAKGWNAGDAVAYAAPFSEDALFIGPNGNRGKGRAAIQALHVFLLGGPFKGSTNTPTIVDVEILGGHYAVLDADIDITGFRGLPPGVIATAPGLLRTRSRTVLEFKSGVWQIIRQQLTAVAPAPPAP